jgi:hypothetical protein
MAAAAPTAGPPGKGRGKLGAWVKKNKAAAAAVGAGGLLVAFVLVRKGQSQGATDAAGTAQPGTIDPSLYGTPADLAGVGGGIGSDSVTGLSEQISALQNQLTNITQAQAPAQQSGSPTPTGGTTPGTVKSSKYVTKTGHLQPWVINKLGIKSNPGLGSQYITKTGQLQPWVMRKLAGK